jgi:hypothetical protein
MVDRMDMRSVVRSLVMVQLQGTLRHHAVYAPGFATARLVALDHLKNWADYSKTLDAKLRHDLLEY